MDLDLLTHEVEGEEKGWILRERDESLLLRPWFCGSFGSVWETGRDWLVGMEGKKLLLWRDSKMEVLVVGAAMGRKCDGGFGRKKKGWGGKRCR